MIGLSAKGAFQMQMIFAIARAGIPVERFFGTGSGKALDQSLFFQLGEIAVNGAPARVFSEQGKDLFSGKRPIPMLFEHRKEDLSLIGLIPQEKHRRFVLICDSVANSTIA